MAVIFRALVCASLLISPSLGTSEASDSHTNESVELSVGRIVVVHSPVSLTPAEHGALIANLRRNLSQGQTLVLTQDVVGELVREAYQDKGYYRAEVSPQMVQQRHPGGTAMIVSVTPGKQFHLLGISWRGNSAFSEAQLAGLIPFRPGELLRRKKIVKGLEAAQKLYDSHGYINYICIPEPRIDEEAATVAFVMNVDEGGQFRFGDLRVQGMLEAHRKVLLSAWDSLRGKPYREHDAHDFFNRFFKSPAPHIEPEDYVSFKIDRDTHTVNYTLALVPSLRFRVNKNLELQPIAHP